MDEESPAHKLAEQVRGRNDRLTDTEPGRLSFLNGQAAAAILEEALEDRDLETAKKVAQLLKNARTGAMDKVPLSDLEDLKERHKENVETAKMPHASRDSDITALQEEQDHGIINPAQDARKEDFKNGRKQREERGAFLRRAADEGFTVLEGKTVSYGYRPVQGQLAKENARQVQEELRRLKIDAEVIDRSLLWNQSGTSSIMDVSEAVVAEGHHIFISDHTGLPPRNVAGHEAFHFWKNGIGRDAYVKIIEDNLDVDSRAFIWYQHIIAETYLGDEADSTDDAQMSKLREELLAYISGDIHAGIYDDSLRPMFKDYDAVKAAWKALVQENGAGGKTSSVQWETDWFAQGFDQEDSDPFEEIRRYEYPKLNKQEWALLLRTEETEITSPERFLNNNTKWLFASQKGVRVFALYGIGDGTEPTTLYSFGGEKAIRDQRKLHQRMEGGGQYGMDRDRTTFGRILADIESRPGGANDGVYHDGDGETAVGDVPLSERQRAGDGRGDRGGGTEIGEDGVVSSDSATDWFALGFDADDEDLRRMEQGQPPRRRKDRR